MKIVNFSDYQYLIDKSGDCARAIIKALCDVKSFCEDCTLSFDKNTYHIYKDFCEVREYHTSNTDSVDYPQKTIGFLIENQKNLTIEGNGCEFIFHGDLMAFAIVKSQNIKLSNFSWDMAQPTVTQLSTVSSNGNTISYSIPSTCPFEIEGRKIKWICGVSPYTQKPYYVEKNHHASSCLVGFDPDSGIKQRYSLSVSPFSHIKSIKKTGGNSVDIKYWFKAPKTWAKPGMSCEMCASKHRPTAGAFIWESENVTSEKITVHYLHGFGWLTQMSRNVSFLNCRFEPNNKGNTCVSYADLIHVSGAGGKINIENCYFSHAHDDPINIHGTFTRAEKLIDKNTLVLKYVHRQQGGFPQFHDGDEVVFYSRDTLSPLCGKERIFTVKKAGIPGGDHNDMKSMAVVFNEELPDEIMAKIGSEPKYVAENITYTPEVTIRNCTFDHIPTRGILCTTRKKVLIENNRFDHIAMACIFISNDSSDWYESGPVRDVTIKNNEFFIRESGQKEWNDAPAVYVHPVTKGGKIPDKPVHKNITIENNTIHLYHDKAFVIESVENITVKNNQIKDSDLSSDKIFEFSKCKNIDTDLK